MGLKRILICEDEKLITDRLYRFLKEIIDFPAEIHTVATLNQGLEFLAEFQINLLFLDLNLHGKDGFEILKRLSSESFHTIIVSAYTEKAIEAFEYGVLDFVGKPFTKERLGKAIDRFSNDEVSKTHGLKYVAIKNRKGVEFIAVDTIDYIKASGIYSELILLDGGIKVYDKPMNQLLKLLSQDYIRVHRSYVAPLRNIKSIHRRKANAYDISLHSGLKIPISRSSRKTLIHQLNKELKS